MSYNAQDYINRLSSFFPRKGRWPLHEPIFDGNEADYVNDCVVTGWVSSVGSYVDRFEQDLATITGAKRAVAVVNGTAAIEVALSVAGVIAGDEVVVPGITFVATANAIHHLGAIAHFSEVEEVSLGLDPVKLRDFLESNTVMAPRGRLNTQTGRVISAIVPVHIFGFACQIEEICKIAEAFGLVVVEDAAEGLGSSFAGKHVGRFGRFGALSFNGNKIITCGGGGAIITDSDELADRLKHITTTARVASSIDYYHDEVAWNFRLPNINAALGVAQLEKLPEALRLKADLAKEYLQFFSEDPIGIEVMATPAGTVSNHWLNAIVLPTEVDHLRDEILVGLNSIGIEARPLWRPINQLPMYKNNPSFTGPVCAGMAQRVINLPSGVGAAREILKDR